MRSKRTLVQVAADACDFIQTMNDRYTKPSGIKSPAAEPPVNPLQGEDAVSDADLAASVEPLSAVKSETN
jgi:hypothetical protein